MTTKPRFVTFAHNANYDNLHQVGMLGLTAAAMGKDVISFDRDLSSPLCDQRNNHHLHCHM